MKNINIIDDYPSSKNNGIGNITLKSDAGMRQEDENHPPTASKGLTVIHNGL